MGFQYMKNKDQSITANIIDYCNTIDGILKECEYDYDIFVTDRTVQLATSMCIIQIGELVNRLSDDFKEKYDYIEWQQIKGMRNITTHRYDVIDFSILWETLTVSVPELKRDLDSIEF